jgi:dTDP-4-amino-4,6-dideoxygalactose transaminase
MRVPFVQLAPQNVAIESELTEAFRRVLASGRYLMGPEVEAFEKDLASGHNVPHAVALASGTDSCEVAIRACGWSGQTVATPAFGAVPTINAIEAAGAFPALVDVDPVTRGVSFDTLAQVKTTGAIVVHMFGMPCDVPAGAIEDCAHAQGATALDSKGIERKVGTIGIAGAFSFFPTKCLGAMGDGGAIVTRDPELAARARAIRHYGGLLAGDVEGRGQNSRLSEMSAAILSVKLSHLWKWNARRRILADRYSDALRGRVKVPVYDWRRESVHHVYVIEYEERDRLKAALEERGVGTMIHYAKPIHFYRRWRHLGAPGDFPVSERLAATVLSLPLYPELTEEDQDAVIAAVKECC